MRLTITYRNISQVNTSYYVLYNVLMCSFLCFNIRFFLRVNDTCISSFSVWFDSTLFIERSKRWSPIVFIFCFIIITLFLWGGGGMYQTAEFLKQYIVHVLLTRVISCRCPKPELYLVLIACQTVNNGYNKL